MNRPSNIRYIQVVGALQNSKVRVQASEMRFLRKTKNDVIRSQRGIEPITEEMVEGRLSGLGTYVK